MVVARPLSVVVLAVFLVLPANALGHAKVEHSEPAEGASVSAPSEVKLTFTSEVERGFGRFSLEPRAGSKLTLAEPKGRGLTRTLAIPVPRLEPGAYRFRWSVVARDGHRIEGVVAFTVR